VKLDFDKIICYYILITTYGGYEMTLSYFVEHNFFKKMILEKLNPEALKPAIEREADKVFTSLIMGVVNTFAETRPDEAEGIAYETSFISLGDIKAARCKFTGTLPRQAPDCASIIIAITDKVYYFTVEKTIGEGYMLCRWDGDRHLNYGPIAADEPELYSDRIKAVIEQE